MNESRRQRRTRLRSIPNGRTFTEQQLNTDNPLYLYEQWLVQTINKETIKHANVDKLTDLSNKIKVGHGTMMLHRSLFMLRKFVINS